MYWLLILLVSNCRSLFVPYFKYLLDSCIRHLTVAEDENIAFPRKKKAKIQDANSNKDDGHRTMTPHMWHLRALVLSSLHKCFLYDTGSLKFLDSSNFQVSGAPFWSLMLATCATITVIVYFIKPITGVRECVGQLWPYKIHSTYKMWYFLILCIFCCILLKYYHGSPFKFFFFPL